VPPAGLDFIILAVVVFVPSASFRVLAGRSPASVHDFFVYGGDVAEGELIAETRYGRLSGGRSENGAVRFLGIPYAAPPLGTLRWRPPVAPEPWTGLRPADSYGPVAPQPPPSPFTSVPGDPSEWSEDCLSLNVWSPSLHGSRPVMVFFHGGAFVSGSGASALYEGSQLAIRGDVVVVTVNYRLGSLGFLAHPGLRDPVSGFAGNWGLLDQVAALSWVKEHAKSFGGDPTRITVFGESAGGIGICALMAALEDSRSREALSALGADPGVPGGGGGLFRRAIVESGPPVAVWMATASKVAERLVARLGLPELDREKLSLVPAADLIEAQGQLTGGEGDFVAMPFLPVVDERFLFELPGSVLAGGGCSGVDLLMGTNKDEVAPMASPEVKGGIEGLVDRMAVLLQRMEAVRSSGDGPSEHARVAAREIVEGYLSMASRAGEGQDVKVLSARIATDWVFRMPAIRALDGHARSSGATFAYLFTWESPLMDGALGSCHALELPFVFGTFGHPVISMFSGSGQEASELSEKIQDSWTAFARCGDPSGGKLGEWGAYDLPQRATMLLGKKCKLAEDPNREARMFWESLEGIGRLEEPPRPGSG